jgi:hypothetical protein
MAYVGNKPDVNYTSFQKQDLTGATGGTLTLSTPVTNANDIQLFINHVRQESGTSYTASGTTVTLQGYTVSASDDIYVIYHQAFQTTQPPDGSVGTAKIADDAVTSAKLDTNIAIDGDLTVDTNTLKVDSSNNRVGIGTSPSHPFHLVTSTDGTGVSGDDTWAAVIQNAEATDARSYGLKIMAGSTTDQAFAITDHDGSNDLMAVTGSGYVTTPKKPYFHAYGNSGQSWSGSQAYQVVIFNNVYENNGNHYNTSTYTYTIPVAGAYFFWYTFTNQTDSSTGPEAYLVYTPSGGSSSYRAPTISYAPYYTTVGNSAVINCAKDATVNVRLINNNNTSFTIGGDRSTFGGYLIG